MKDPLKLAQQAENAAKWFEIHGRNTNEAVSYILKDCAECIRKLVNDKEKPNEV